mgnify:CR=1 FL=1
MVDVSIAASPTLLIEEENTATTLTIELNDPPPADGLIVPFDISIDSGRSKPLAQFDLNNINFEGAELLEGPDLDTLNEFALVVQAQTARLTLPVNNDEFEEGVDEVTFQVKDTADFNIAPNAGEVTFTIADNAAVPPEPPQFVGAPFMFEIVDPPEAQDGDEMGTVEVENLEGISFQFTEGNVDADEDGTAAFAIADDGVVTIADVDDLQENFQLTVEATNEFGSNEANVTIPFTIVDSFPVITPPDAPIRISEDFQEGDEVFTVEATDPAGDEITTFEITNGNEDIDEDGTPAFAIDDEGVVTVQDTNDLEADTTFDLEIVATDGEGAESDAVTFDVEVGEAESAQPPSVTANVNDIGENQPAGTFVGQVSAVDPDDETEEFEFELVGDNLDLDGDGEDVFAINADGEITVNDTDDLNFEQQESFTFNVTATEVGTPDELTGQTEVTVGVVEVQEEELSSDFNNDGFVNLDDLDVFASAFGSQQGEDNFNPIADLTGDGLVNLDDLGAFASEFGSELG